MSDWNAAMIEEFRAKDGKVDGQFAGADLVLLHHVGRRSGREYVAPVVYFRDDEYPDAVLVVASAAGAPHHPQWYENLVTAGRAVVEVGGAAGTGIDTREVRVEELTGEARDRAMAAIVAQAPGFGGYEKKTEGIRTIPVLALHRS